jgi:pyruvate dehydrogenase E2 component (dihydrolipoamide acetyltransferase)
MTEITMPRLSDSMEEGTILSWLKSDGETVASGDELVEIETDKATMTYESPADGVLAIVADPGSTLAVGAVIAEVNGPPATSPPAPEAPADGASEFPPDAGPDATGPSSATVAAATERGPAKFTPLARRLALEHGIDLAQVVGTGPNGRVRRADVAVSAGLAAVEPPEVTPAIAEAPRTERQTGSPAPPTTGAKGEPTIVEPTRTQRLIARRMAETKATVPDFQVQTEVSMDAALALRGQLKELLPDAPPSVNDLIVKATALALRQHPRANAAYKNGRFELYPRVNVGIAVAADEALVVPTIMDADTLSLEGIAHESRRLASRVRSGEITPPELSGATFTVSNLGMYGMTAITPVINSPQAAILGVGVSRTVPVLRDGVLIERQLMTLTLSCDHRILYGAEASQFVWSIAQLLEQPLLMVL